eukprot:2302402-Pleurochrysis_carterae.AAC.2
MAVTRLGPPRTPGSSRAPSTSCATRAETHEADTRVPDADAGRVQQDAQLRQSPPKPGYRLANGLAANPLTNHTNGLAGC